MCVNQLIIGNASVGTRRSRPVSLSQNDRKESGNQSNAAVLSAWTYVFNIVLRGLYMQRCIKTLTYVHKDTTYNFPPYTKKEEERKKKPEGRKQFCCYSIRFQIFLRILHNSMLLMLENYYFFPPLGTFIVPASKAVPYGYCNKI